MKVSIILGNEPVTIASLTKQLSNFDWSYDLCDDLNKIRKGELELEQIQRNLCVVWDSHPNVALKLWYQYCPYAKGLAESNELPSFIHKYSIGQK